MSYFLCIFMEGFFMCFSFTAVFNMFALLPFDFMLHCALSLHVMLVVVEKKKDKELEIGEPLEPSSLGN